MKESTRDASFINKCLQTTVRFMWQTRKIPEKIGVSIGTLLQYAQDSVGMFLCVTGGKARRKERDGDQSSTDTKLYLEESVLERKLPDADLKALVDLPAGLDYNEWLASHTLALFEHVNLVYGTISEFCTPSGCPDMTGPANRTYLWFDEKGKKTRVAAPQYIDYVMTFTQKTVSDESIFPTKYANEFPSSFESIARKILRLQFHVIAHLYAAHFREIALLGLHTHLNLTFAHLTALHRRFNLIDEKETDVLRDLEIALRLTDDGTNCSMSGGSVAGSNSASGTGSGSGSGSCSGTGSGGSSTIGSGCNSHCSVGGTGVGGTGGGGGSSSVGQSNISLTSESAISSSTSSQIGGATGMAVTTMTGTVTGTSEDINLLQCGRIDGDATIKPICTQPEGMKGGFNSDLMDIRNIGVGVSGGNCLIGGNSLIGAGGNSIVGGILGSFTSDLIDTGYCSNKSSSSTNIGGINNTSNSSNNSSHIGNVLNFNNTHHSNTHNALTANSILQCNSNNSPSSHTTTTA